MRSQKILWIVALFMVIISVLPLIQMIFSSLLEQESFSKLIEIFQNPHLLKSFKNSLWLSLLVALTTSTIGLLLGILLGKSNLHFYAFFVIFLTLPLLISPYIIAYGWVELLGHPTWLFGFWGVFMVLCSIYLPIPLLLSLFFLKQIDSHLEEVALLVGGWQKVIFGVLLPLLRPALFLSFILVFILSFGEFSVANFLRYPIFAMESFTQFSAFYDFQMATLTALPMIVVVFVVIILQQYLSSKYTFQFESNQNERKIELQQWQKPLFVLLLLFSFVTVILPLLSLLLHSTTESFIIALSKAQAPLFRSFLYAFLGATLLMVFGFLNGYILEHKIVKPTQLWEALNFFIFALPSTVLGIALILFWNNPYTNIVYATPLIILFGYVAKYLLLSSKISQINFAKIPKNIIEATKVSGISWYKSLFFLQLPLSKSSLMLSWIVGFIFSFRELTITMLVYPAGLETLPIYIITQMANGEPSVLASLGVILVVSVVLFLILFRIILSALADKNTS